MSSKKDELELDLLITKINIIQGITNCTSHKQLEQFIYGIHRIFRETEFLSRNKAEGKEIVNAKILKEH